MPYHLGVVIEQVRITDKCAKIISLSMLGLCNKTIAQVLDIGEQTIRNEVSNHYGLLNTERVITALTVRAEQSGFHKALHYNGTPLLDEIEHERLRHHYHKIPVSLRPQVPNLFNNLVL